MAKENVLENNVENIEFIAGDVKEEVIKLSQILDIDRNIDLIIIDPPKLYL